MMILMLAAAMTVAMLIATVFGLREEAERVRVETRHRRVGGNGFLLIPLPPDSPCPSYVSISLQSQRRPIPDRAAFQFHLAGPREFLPRPTARREYARLTPRARPRPS